MGIQCKYCGVDLPKDDARFCNKCGMLVSSRPLSSQSVSAAKNGSKIAEPSSSREQQERKKRVLREQVAELSPSRSKSGHLELDEPVEKLDVYEQKPVEPEKLQSEQSPSVSTIVEELPLEKLPETPQPELEEDMLSPIDEIASPASSNDEVASVHTSHENDWEDEEASEQADGGGTVAIPSTQEAAQEQFVEDGRAVRRPRKRWPLVVVALLLLVLIVGGLGAAMMLSQPSSNDPVIQSQVRFRDAQLGVALLYPNGWIKQVGTGNSNAHFYASNHVGEVDIMAASNGGNVKQALQQQATKMGMSGKKVGVSLNFAGESWQQLQGTLQVSGASYTDTILATTHGNQLFMMVQQAPQNNYSDWEKEFFVPLRASFKFL